MACTLDDTRGNQSSVSAPPEMEQVPNQLESDSSARCDEIRCYRIGISDEVLPHAEDSRKYWGCTTIELALPLAVRERYRTSPIASVREVGGSEQARSATRSTSSGDGVRRWIGWSPGGATANNVHPQQ